MSKISDRLTKLGHIERSGFGFGASSTSTKIPVILVGVNGSDSKKLAEFDADFCVLDAAKNGAAQSKSVGGDSLWGVSVSGGSSKEIDAAVESGADFLIAESEAAPGAALRNDDTAKGFVVDVELSDNRAKAVDSGPFDFLVLDGSSIDTPMSVGTVLDLQEQLARYSNHIFLKMSATPDKESLELLRDIGISALLYSSEAASPKEIEALRGTIDEIEPKKSRSTAGASLPRATESTVGDGHEDHDHDVEDDDWE